MEPHDIDLFNRTAGVVFTHPMQSWLWRRDGFKGRSTIRPIGSRRDVIVRSNQPDKPTVGFFCGENLQRWKGSDLFERVIHRLRTLCEFDVLMIGRNLDHISYLGNMEDRAAGINDYQRIDSLFCASISPGIPLSVYEALAAAVPVVSTRRWFVGRTPRLVRFGSTESQLVKQLYLTIKHRRQIYEMRSSYVYMPYVFENWIEHNLIILQKWCR